MVPIPILFAKGFLAVARHPEIIRVNEKYIKVYIFVKTFDVKVSVAEW